jgi:hypothetical protein
MFKNALFDSSSHLRHLKEQEKISAFALIGAFAVSRWARPRATADIDYVFRLGSLSAHELAIELSGQWKQGNLGDPLLGVIEYSQRAYVEDNATRDDNTGVVPIQLVLLPPAWEEIALYDLSDIDIDGTQIPIADWKALVLLKLYAGSALDLEDARSILSEVEMTEVEKDYLTKKATRLRISRRLDRVLGR